MTGGLPLSISRLTGSLLDKAGLFGENSFQQSAFPRAAGSSNQQKASCSHVFVARQRLMTDSVE